MSRGSEDFSNVKSGGIAYSVAQAWETLNRPPGIVSQDLRGECIYYNRFEMGDSGIAYSATNTGFYTGLWSDRSHMGGFSARLATSGTASSEATLSKRIHYDKLTKVGVETRILANETNTFVDIKIEYTNGTNVWDARIRFDTATKEIKYFNTAASYVAIPSGETNIHPYDDFVYYKLVVDIENDLYSRLIIGSLVIDLSDLAVRKQTTSTKNNFIITIIVSNQDASSREAIIDNIVITVNEP